MNIRTLTLTALLLGVVTATAAQEPPDLSGHWRLNPELSDDPKELFANQGERQRAMKGGGRAKGAGRGMGRRGEGGFGGGAPSSEGGRGRGVMAMLGGGESMTLALDERWFTITDAEGRERRFILGGTTSTPMGGATHTEWQGDQLVLRGEGRGERGPRADRRYTLSPDGQQLHLLVEIETRRGDTLRLTRLYDRGPTPPTHE